MNTTETKALSTVMDQVNVELKVDMKDVVDVFLAKYETSLHAERTLLQREMAAVNGQLKNLTESLVATTKLFATTEAVPTTVLGVFSVSSKPINEPTIDWIKKEVTFLVEVLIQSLTVTSGYNHKSHTTIAGMLPIPNDSQETYHFLMDTKSGLTDKLNVVNTNLRDMGRKERQIKGKMAEMKLQELGMEDLLQEPALLALINDPLQS